MRKISTSIGHLKTFIIELEDQANKLEGGTKSAAPKVRAYAQKMKVILGELRKDTQEFSNAMATKPRASRVEVVVEEQESDESQEVINPVAIVAEAMEEMPPPLLLQRAKSVRKSRGKK